MVRTSRLVGLCLLGMGLVPSTAGWAATASATGDHVVYTAAPGETNAVVVTEDDSAVRIADSGATITPGPGCVLDGADAVCETSDPSETHISLRLGDGDDSADLSAVHFPNEQPANFLSGGPGNDHLTGSAGDDLVHGNEGSDELDLGAGFFDEGYGGAGDDTIHGGVGIDLLHGGPGGNDLLDGGPGRFDAVSAQGVGNLRLTPTALFGAGTDRLTAIEDAYLTGDSGRNVINARAWRGATWINALRGDDFIVGGVGQDSIFGGRGNDLILGRAGMDVLWGGWGADVFFARDHQFDEVHGGSGFDRAHLDGSWRDFATQIEAFF